MSIHMCIQATVCDVMPNEGLLLSWRYVDEVDISQVLHSSTEAVSPKECTSGKLSQPLTHMSVRHV